MAIDAGDVVVTFLGDATQLDQTLAAVTAKTQETSKNIQTSFSGFDQVIDEQRGAWDGLTPRIQDVGEQTKQAMDKGRSAAYEARGEIGLLGELFGVHLPRHVRSWLADLGPVQTVMSSAFGATAIIFVIEALAKGIEKINQWREHADKIAAAWEKYDQTIFESSTHMQQEIDKQQQKLIEMTQGPVAGLDFALKHLQSTATETFKLITADVETAVKAMNESSSSLLGIQFNVFKDAGKDLEKFRLELEKTMREAQQKAPSDPFAPLNAGVELYTKRNRELTDLIHQREAASGKDASAATDGLHAERQAMDEVFRQLQQGIKLQELKIKVEKEGRAVANATEDAGELKRGLELQIAKINEWKEAQHSAYLAHNIDLSTYKANEEQALTAIGIAQIAYQTSLVTNLKKAGEVEKAKIEQEKLDMLLVTQQTKSQEALNVATEKHRLAVRRVFEEYQHLEQQNVEKEWTSMAAAANRLAEAQVTLAKAEKTLNEIQVASHYKEQEEAITQLAQFGLITEQQKEQRLKALYEQEKQDALQPLKDLLKQESDLINSYEQQIVSAKGNPFFTRAELMNLEANLAKARASYKMTEAEMEKTQGQLDTKINKSEKIAHGYFEQMVRDMKHGVSGMVQLKEMGKQTFDDLTKALEQSIAAALTSTQSFGQAMRQATAQAIAALAAQALVKALFYTAEGVAHLAMWDFSGAAQYFEAAALMGALGGAAGATAHAMSGGGGGGSKGAADNNKSQIDSNAPGNKAGGPTGTTVTVPHLDSGALVMKPTLAMVAEKRPEGVFPLNDPRVMQILSSMHGGEGGVHNVFKIASMISTSDVSRLGRVLTRASQTGRVRVSVSNASRVTRKV